MSKTMKASECKAKFFWRRVIVTKNGKPIAEIVPFVERPKSIIGALKGQVILMGDLEPTGEDWEAFVR